MRPGIFRAGEKLGELRESESGQDRHDISIVAEVKIKTLIEGKRDGIVVQRGVDL
jgi:hypothetical protein